MTPGQILKKLVISLGLRHEDIREIFHLSGKELSSSQVRAWMSGKNHKNHQGLSMEELGTFLDGFITYSRGPKDAPSVLPLAITNLIYRLGEEGRLDALEHLLALVQDLIQQVAEAMANEEEP